MCVERNKAPNNYRLFPSKTVPVLIKGPFFHANARLRRPSIIDIGLPSPQAEHAGYSPSDQKRTSE